jgi:hypothetical protein
VVVRLQSGLVAVISSGPFTPREVASIETLGRPAWLIEAMLRHDTFSADGRRAFPGSAFLAPPGFEQKVPFPVRPILPTPEEWGSELQALELEGAPKVRETVLFHAPSRTLIVEDLAFNFPPPQPPMKEFLLRLAVGKRHQPGIPRSVRLSVKDHMAFKRSLIEMFKWDFYRVIVAHGDRIESDGKEILRLALTRAEYFIRLR